MDAKQGNWVFGIFCLCMLSAILGAVTDREEDPDTCSTADIETCLEGDPIPRHDWTQPGAFDDLSMDEIKSVTEYMFENSGIDLVPLDEAGPADPFIFMMERVHPIKDEVIDYLDNEGAPPSRDARVVVFRGDLPGSEAAVHEFKVGPLPNPTRHEQYRDPVPFHARTPLNLPQTNAVNKWVEDKLFSVNQILEESTGYTYKNYANCTTSHSNCLIWYPSIPAHVETGHHFMFVYLTRLLEGGFLYPVGFQMLVNLDSPLQSDWKVEKVWYQGTYFDSLDVMVEAYNKGDLVPRKLEEPEGAYTPNLASSMNFRGDPLPKKPKAGVRSYYPDGRRFQIKGHHVEWQGWQLDFALRMSQGLLVHDVRYRGERIAYEISLQEIAVIYSAASPGPMHTTYQDSITLTGLRDSQLFRGIDCPEEAAFFDFPYYLDGRPFLFKDSVCVFEHDRGVPLRRHYDSNNVGGYYWAQGMRDIVLVTRAVFTVYNYDYIVDVMLHQGGEIEVKTSLSGYTLNSFYTGPEEDKYGHQTQKDSIANIHHHLLHFKADLDIGGTRSNRFQSLDLSIEEIDDPAYPGVKTANKFLTRNTRNTETEAAIKYNFDNVGYLVQYADTSRNKLGYPRGYRIANAAMSKLLIPNTFRGDRSRAWMEYQVAVTRQHDNEPRSSSQYATMEPFDPVVSFQDFIDDDESIIDEDLVSWITLGVHHIPHSEDVPVVLSPAVQLTFFLLPYNYFDEDPSLASRDNIRVTPGENGRDIYQYSGVQDTFCCKPRTITGNGEEVDCVKTGQSRSTAQDLTPVFSTLISSLLLYIIVKN